MKKNQGFYDFGDYIRCALEYCWAAKWENAANALNVALRISKGTGCEYFSFEIESYLTYLSTHQTNRVTCCLGRFNNVLNNVAKFLDPEEDTDS